MKKATAISLNVVAVGILGIVLCWHWQDLMPILGFNQPPIESPVLPGQPTPAIYSNLLAAIKSFSQDYASRGQPLRASFTLRDLVKGGYINTNNGLGLDGLDSLNVTFNTEANESDPQALLMQMHLPDVERKLECWPTAVFKM